MVKTEHQFDWSDLAFASKRSVKELRSTFIAAPRDISKQRFTQLIKTYLPKGNILLGLSKDPYVLGLEGQDAFRMLELKTVEGIIQKVNSASPEYKIYSLAYFQRDLPHVLEKLTFSRAVFINGSWYHAFHLRPEYYALVNQHTPYELVSPFVDEAEARQYAAIHNPVPPEMPKGLVSDQAMAELADGAAKQSFAYSEHQTGVALGKKTVKGYRALTTAFNRVVPYQTYAMHFGASREHNFSPMNDLNHYDADHAEVELLTQALSQKMSLRGTTLFINLLPCPSCARMLTATEIEEIVYRQDHSEGYAIKLLETAGKKVRRLT